MSQSPNVDPASVGPLLAQLGAPLLAVSTHANGVDNAQIAVTASAASIVLHRPRVIVQIYHTNYTHRLIAESGVMALNFLSPEQLPLIWQLGMRSGRDGNKLADVPYARGSTGSPILTGGSGYLDCRVVNAMDGGDMTAFLAEVVSGATHGGQPLRWRDARPRLPQQWADEWDRKIAGEMAVSEIIMDTVNPAAWANRTFKGN